MYTFTYIHLHMHAMAPLDMYLYIFYSSSKHTVKYSGTHFIKQHM